MKKVILIIIALLIIAGIKITMFYNEVTNYAIEYNQRISDIQNKYDTSLDYYKNNKSKAINYLKNYATKGNANVKCSINDVKATIAEDGLQTFKIRYRTIENYNIGKYIAFITIENGDVASISIFRI